MITTTTVIQTYILLVTAVVAAVMVVIVRFVVLFVVAAGIFMWARKLQTAQKPPCYSKCTTILLSQLTVIFAGLQSRHPTVAPFESTVPEPIATVSTTTAFAGFRESAALAYRIACHCGVVADVLTCAQ